MRSLRGVPRMVGLHGRMASVSIAGLMLCAYFLAPSALWAQGTTSGSIKGTVTDTSGAVVAGAKVTVTNKQTNASQTVIAGGDGGYFVPNLPVSTYTVTAEKEGFSTAVHENVAVNVGAGSVIDIPMAVGTVSQTVTVQAQVAPITEDKGDRSVNLQSQTLEELPLQVSGGARLVDAFLTLSPGVTGDTFSARINGAPDMSQDFFYDGAPYMNGDGGGRQEGLGPSFEAVDEFAINTNAYSAQYGRGSGLLNFHIRSGTNKLHGSAWEFLRNNVLDSRGHFAPKVGTEKQNEFGFRLGGPVNIPKVYDGRDKTFVFGLVNWFRFRGGSSNNLLTLPTARMKTGDFSELLPNIIIYDPLTTRPDPSGGLTRDPFPGNIIPPFRESALSKPYIDLVPTATLPGIFNNARVSVPTAPQNYFTYLIKVDHNISTKTVLHGSYYKSKYNSPTSPQIPGPLGVGNNFNVIGWEPRLSLDHNIASNIQNQTAFTVQYTQGQRVFFPLVTNAPNSLATAGLPYPAFAVQDMPTFGGGANNNQNSGGCWPCVYFADNLKWLKGRHAFSFGTELRWEDERDAFAENIGTYSFTRGTTSLPNSPKFGTLGYGFASFFIGTPTSATRTGFAPPRINATAYRAFYAQDDFRVTRNLTLNLGLRWDVNLPVQDPHKDDFFSTFDPTVPNPGAGNLPGSIVYAGNSGGPCIAQGGASLCRKRIADTYWNMWQPRLGFAYRWNDKTVLRGGFGKSSLRGGASTLEGPSIAAAFLTGFQFQDNLQTPDSGISPPLQLQPTWDVGIPPVRNPPPRTRTSANGQDIDFMQRVDGKNGYMMNWSLTVERRLPGQVVLETSYVGSSSVRIGANMTNENQVPSKYLSLGQLLTAKIDSPEARAANIPIPYAGFTGSVAQALRPFPQYLSIRANTQASGHSSYHSLQMRAQKNFSDGVSFLVSFTWYKNLSNGRSQFAPFYGPPLDTANQGLEKAVEAGPGSAGPRLLSISGTYELPIGPGKKYLNEGGLVGKVVGGWNIGAVATYNAGGYLGISGGTRNPIFNSPYGFAFLGGGGPRPDRVPGADPKAFHGGKFDPKTDYYLNPAAFSDAGAFKLGNAPPVLPNVRGFAYYNENFSFIKRTPITESTNLEFRSEFFNAFNRTVYGGPNTNFNSVATGGFGKIGGQANSPRVIQFALKLNF